MFKSVLFLCLAAAALANKEGGLCMDDMELSLACTANTPVQDKLIQAFANCFMDSEAQADSSEEESSEEDSSSSSSSSSEEDESSSEEEEKEEGSGLEVQVEVDPAPQVVTRRRKAGQKNKKNKKKCPTAEKILQMVQRKMKGDLCMLSSLGWIDDNGEPDNATITADVLSLEPAVYTQLSGDEIEACAAERMAKWASPKDKHAKRCAAKMTEDDKAQLSFFGSKMAHYKCFTDMFHRACRQSVGKKIHDLFAPAEEMQPAAVPLTAATRTIGGQGRQCLQTCCAANFASTTSCTFGAVIQQTRACNQVFGFLSTNSALQTRVCQFAG